MDNKLFSTEFPNADHFFSSLNDTNGSNNDNDGEYRRDIAFLSTLLKRVRWRKSTSVPGTTHRKLGLWSHLAYLLTTSEATQVVAVTGRVEADTITSVVFTQNNSVLNNSTPQIDIKEPALLGDLESLLGDSQLTGSTNFISHAQAVRSVINYVLNDSFATPLSFVHKKVFGFVIRRVAFKAWARIVIGERIWKQHPIIIICKWYSIPENMNKLTPKTFHLGPRFQGALEKLGIPPDEINGSSYTISSQTAGKWIQVVESCLKLLISNLSSATTDSARRLVSRVAKTPDSDGVRWIDATMYLYLEILRAEIFYHLMSPRPLIRELVHGFTNGCLKRNTEKETGEDLDEQTEAEAVDEASVLFLDVSRHVVRYLQTMVAPRAAVDALVYLPRREGHEQPRRSFEMVVIKALPPGIGPADDYFDCFMARYTSAVPKAEVYLKKHLFKGNWLSTPVHAEAALMGIACATDPVSKGVQNLMATAGENLMIGGSKKCCFCCALLAELLASGTTKRRFTGLDSHATILPWLAPYGIPVNLLHQIRNKLFEVLNREVETAWNEHNSRQTLSRSRSPVPFEDPLFDVSSLS